VSRNKILISIEKTCYPYDAQLFIIKKYLMINRDRIQKVRITIPEELIIASAIELCNSSVQYRG